MNQQQQTSSSNMVSSERLNRIEDKIDKLAETVVSLARVEEKLLNLEKSNQCVISQLSTTRNDLAEVDTRITNLESSMSSINKVIWYVVSAVVSGEDPNPAFLRANYDLYQKDSGFTGMMLINFPAQALKYFKDPMQMASEIYAFQIYLVSANAGFQARQILSQVTLRPVKEPTSTSTGARARKSKKTTAEQPVGNTKKEVAAAEKRLAKTVIL
jgi:hypothetical protein